MNSLEQLDFVLKSRSHTNPTHTHTCWHTLFLATSDLSAAGGNIIQSVSRVYQQMSTIWWLPAHQPPVSCWIPHPSLSLSLPAQFDHWKVSSHHFLCINSSTAAMHLWYHKSLCKEMCVRVCKESQNRCRWAAVCPFSVCLTVDVTLPSEKSLCLVLKPASLSWVFNFTQAFEISIT